jgi:uncharacterized protein (TIGR03083 family)
MKPERFYAELCDQTALLADALHGLDLARPVPTCPEWTVADLVEHVGLAHRWISTMVERRVTRPISKADVDDHHVPADPDERSAWLTGGARRLADALRDAGPQTRMWTWAPDKTAGFWLRRITHDTLVHRVDAEVTAGRDITIAADLAADSVSDLLSTFSVLPTIDDFPRLAALCANGETLHFHATDPDLGTEGEWLVRRGDSGLEWEHGHRRADVAVRGTAADLIMVLTRRAEPDPGRVEIIGDRELFAHWLENAVF